MFKLLLEASKYAAASVIALGADYAVLLALTRFGGWHYLWANSVSFLTGAIIAYALSVRFVFSVHRLQSRQLEIASFVLIGLVGLAVSESVLFVTVGRLGIDLLAGKALAAGCSFIANFALRRQLLFRAGAVLA